MRRALVALVLLALSAAPALAERECRSTGSGHVCSEGFSETQAHEETLVGPVDVSTYTDRRDGGDDVDYTVVRDGARVTVASASVDVQRVQYSGVSEDETRPGETRAVRFDEIRVAAGGREVDVGLRRATYSSEGTAAESCDVYATGRSVEAPCVDPVFP